MALLPAALWRLLPARAQPRPPPRAPRRPAAQYAPWFATVVKSAQLAVAILTMLEGEARASRLSFADIVRKLAELPEAAPAFVSKRVRARARACGCGPR